MLFKFLYWEKQGSSKIADLNSELQKKRIIFKSYKLVMACLLLVCWALFQYMLGEWVYSIFIMSLFTLIVLLPKRIAIILVGCAACVLIGTKTSAWKGPKHLLQIDLQIAKNLPETLNEILKPNTGRKQSLPTIAYHVWQFQIKHKVTSYSLDGEKFQDQMINQRVIESIWPAKLEPTAKYKFVLPDVLAKYNNCRIIDQRDDVALIHCP